MAQWQNKEAGWKDESDTNSTDRSLQAGRCQHNIRAVVYTGFRSSAAREWSGWNQMGFRSKDTGLAPLRLEQVDPGPGTSIWFFPKASFCTVTFPCRENQPHRRDVSQPTPSCPVQHGYSNNVTKLFVLLVKWNGGPHVCKEGRSNVQTALRNAVAHAESGSEPSNQIFFDPPKVRYGPCPRPAKARGGLSPRDFDR